MSKTDHIFGRKILERAESSINGEIIVEKSLGLGTYIQVNGLTQSGGVMHSVWKSFLKKLKKRNAEIDNVLILGFGGGSVATLLNKMWPEVKLKGVDIDPVIVKLGKKYLDVPQMDIIYQDAGDYVVEALEREETYDVVFVDTYVYDEFPKKFEEAEFIENVKKIIKKDGVAVFNRLYYGQKRKEAVKFGDKLEEHFSEVERVYPEANLMLICKP